MPETSFPHLTLIKKTQGRPRLSGGGNANPLVQQNKNNRKPHSKFLMKEFTSIAKANKELLKYRNEMGLPNISAGIPFLLQIPSEDDGTLEFISDKLGLELVAEYDDGYLILSSQDLDLNRVIELANNFAKEKRGSAGMASILAIDSNPLSDDRLQRVLDEALLKQWPFQDTDIFTLDVSVEVAPFNTPKDKPSGYRSNMKPDKKQALKTKHEEYTKRFWEHWENETFKRQDEIQNFIEHYNGQILQITDDSGIVEFPDSFSMRVTMNGQGFKDLIENYPNIFEVLIPEDIVQPHGTLFSQVIAKSDFTLEPPDSEAPAICIIDSGIEIFQKVVDEA